MKRDSPTARLKKMIFILTDKTTGTSTTRNGSLSSYLHYYRNKERERTSIDSADSFLKDSHDAGCSTSAQCILSKFRVICCTHLWVEAGREIRRLTFIAWSCQRICQMSLGHEDFCRFSG